MKMRFMILYTVLIILFSSFANALSLDEQNASVSAGNIELTKYAQGTSALSSSQILDIAMSRESAMKDILKQDSSSFFQLILPFYTRDNLPQEIADHVEKNFEELGSILEMYIDKMESVEYRYFLKRDESEYRLYFRNDPSLDPGGYYRISGYLIGESFAVESFQPLLGIKKENPPINPYANGIQKIAFVKLSFQDSPFSYAPGGGKDQVEQAIDNVVNFYNKESFERMNIEAKIFEYTLPYERSSFPCDEGKGDGTQISPEDFLYEITLLKRQGKLHISHEYLTVLGLISEDFCDGTIGIAWLGGGYELLTGIVQLLKPNEGLGSVMAHELGHTRLLPHSNNIPNCPICRNCRECLMWPSISPSNYLDHAIFLPQEKTLLSWDSKLPMPLAVSNIKVWPIANLQGVPTGASLLWDTNYDASSEVDFGTERDNLQWKGVKSLLYTSSQPRFELRGPKVDGKYTPLQLNTVYYYKIKSTGIPEPVKGVTTERRGSFFMADKYWTRYPEIPDDQKLTGGGIVDQSTSFLRGDANEDANVDISDVIYILGALFQGRPLPFCPDAADTNDDGKLDLSDAIHLLQYLYQGGTLPEPSLEQGFDPTVDSLVCSQ